MSIFGSPTAYYWTSMSISGGPTAYYWTLRSIFNCRNSLRAGGGRRDGDGGSGVVAIPDSGRSPGPSLPGSKCPVRGIHHFNFPSERSATAQSTFELYFPSIEGHPQMCKVLRITLSKFMYRQHADNKIFTWKSNFLSCNI